MQFPAPEMANGISSLFCCACVYLYLEKRGPPLFFLLMK